MEKYFKKIIEKSGENPSREGLKKTPRRASDAFNFFTSGYKQKLKDVINDAIYREKCNIGYIPNGKVIGLSKLPRIVNMYSRRLQLQERITAQIADAISKILKPKGVAVVMEASHMCMMMRGVEKEDSRTMTSSVLGSFAKSRKTREEFLKLIGER